ncbi:hypothetical protein ACFYUL_17765 [Streptomyces sp. NPDC004311]|uniref:hypothetical protein n=1 Tax=Streptomyces sp. NPDC004311 TaxID=3364698 RepID=UPI0036C47182
MTAAEHEQAAAEERAELYALTQETDRAVITTALTAHGVDPDEIALILGRAQ